MKFSDENRLRGVFLLRVYRKGKLVEEYRDDNLIVNAAKVALARLIAGEGAGKVVSTIGFGTNGDGPHPGDTALTNAFVKAIASHDYPAPGQVRFNWNLSVTEANGKDIAEFALGCSDGSLFARKTRRPISKDADLALDGSWTIIF